MMESARMRWANERETLAQRRWTKEDGRAMAEAYAASGLSQVAFARRHGLKVERVRWWLTQLNEKKPREPEVTFAPVRLVERASQRRGGVEVVVGRRVVRVDVGFCPDLLREVLAALEEATC
jgi:transposase-like protein